MKNFQTPPFKQNAIALGFTFGVHVLAVVGLLYLGMSKPPKQPEPIKTILVKPQDLPETLREETEFSETAHENIAQEITQTAEPSVMPAPVIPVAPPKTNVTEQQAARLAQEKAKAQADATAKAKAQTDAAAKAQADAAAKAKAQADAAAKAKAQADAAAKAKAQADAAVKAKAQADAAAKAKAQADAAAKAKAQADAAAKAKAQAAAKAKAQADAAAKAKAQADAAAKAKAQADAAAKAKAQADAAAKAKAQADAAAKAKAQADAAAKAKAQADAEAKERAEAEAKTSAAKKAAQEAAEKKAEAKRIASTAKRDFENKVKRAWNPPTSASGQKASARVTLSDSGAVLSVVVNASDPDMKASVEAAVRSAAPYPMPSDPDARREARIFTSSFTAQ
ncbi:cell envelope integrity protein TolA [Acinetobacter sp. GXMZU3951]